MQLGAISWYKYCASAHIHFGVVVYQRVGRMIDWYFTARQHKIGQFVPIYQGGLLAQAFEDSQRGTYKNIQLHAIQWTYTCNDKQQVCLYYYYNSSFLWILLCYKYCIGTKIHNNNKYDASLNLCSLDQIRLEWLAIRVDVGVQFTMRSQMQIGRLGLLFKLITMSSVVELF